MQERQEMWVWSLGQEDTLEREMATHSSIFAWKILWTEEPRRVHTVHWVTKSQTCSWARTHTYMASGYLSRYKPHIHHPGAIIRSRWFSSVQFSRSVMSDCLQLHGLQHARPPCPSPTPRAYPNSCPLSQWCHPTISSPSSPSPPALSLSQHQGLFQGVSS